MPGSSLGFIWAVIVIMSTMLIMALGIMASIVIHGRRTRVSESKFRIAFNSAIDAHILSREANRIIDANDSACRLLSYTRRGLLRTSFDTLIPEGDRQRFLVDVRAVLEKGVDQRSECELKCRDGGTILVEFSSDRLTFEKDAYILWSFRDITERKRAEDALKESEERYRAVWEYSPVGICLTDKDGIYHFANPAYCAIYGYSENELVGRPYYELIMSPEESEGRRERYSMLFEEGVPIPLGETEFISKDGKAIWIQYSGDFVRENGEPKFMVSMNVNITEQKKVRQALIEERKLLEEKNAALKEVLSHLEEEKSRVRGEIAGAIEQSVLPKLNKLSGPDGTVNEVYFNMIRKSLLDLAASTGGTRFAFSKLTPREAEICDLLIAGASSKEISKNLNLSLLTVNSHRQRIRRKLVISNRNINLSSFLRNHQFDK